MKELDVEKVRSAVEMLEAILADRTLMSAIPSDLKRSLVIAAGRVSRPDRLEIMRLGRQYRRGQRLKEKARDREVVATTVIREARKAAVFTPPVVSALPLPQGERPKLNRPRACYVCKTEFDTLHFFYDSMCTPCGDFNYRKRAQTVPLDGRVAVVTGARVKIGYQAALMMLRAGAHVVVTTRFPRDAASRYAREEDFAAWSDRLEIHGLDLRHSPSVEVFCEHMNATHSRLDFLCNNAAQTVRRPPGFYRHLLEDEMKAFHALPSEYQKVLQSHERWKTKSLPPSNDEWVAELSTQGGAIGLVKSALLSQVPYDAADAGMEAFPEGARDADLQQVDKRAMNSWRLKLADVPTPELLEVQLVNSIAPYILCAKLKPLMLRNPTGDRHVVNVSAMEGKFTRYTKTDKHPHTNMAKAALNMMTLTSAPDYMKDGIFMNAVDTGWVTDEDPAQLSEAKQKEHDFQPPLDIVDGAARVCDPFFSGLLTGEHVWGKFLKDYAPTTW